MTHITVTMSITNKYSAKETRQQGSHVNDSIMKFQHDRIKNHLVKHTQMMKLKRTARKPSEQRIIVTSEGTEDGHRHLVRPLSMLLFPGPE